MSVFTNPGSSSKEGAQEYIAAVLDLLGSRDPLEVLQQTPESVRSMVENLTATQMERPEAPGKWSVKYVVHHLADSEIAWAFRLRMVLAHDRPALTGYDQDLWADRLRYDHADPKQSFEVFKVLRHANLQLLLRVPRADWSRAGVHAERGEESLDHMVRLYAGHDLVHLRQLDRIITADDSQQLLAETP